MPGSLADGTTAEVPAVVSTVEDAAVPADVDTAASSTGSANLNVAEIDESDVGTSAIVDGDEAMSSDGGN